MTNEDIDTMEKPAAPKKKKAPKKPRAQVAAETGDDRQYLALIRDHEREIRDLKKQARAERRVIVKRLREIDRLLGKKRAKKKGGAKKKKAAKTE